MNLFHNGVSVGKSKDICPQNWTLICWHKMVPTLILFLFLPADGKIYHQTQNSCSLRLTLRSSVTYELCARCIGPLRTASNLLIAWILPEWGMLM